MTTPIFGMPGTVEVRQGDTVVKVDTTDTVLLLLFMWLVPMGLIASWKWGDKVAITIRAIRDKWVTKDKSDSK